MYASVTKLQKEEKDRNLFSQDQIHTLWLFQDLYFQDSPHNLRDTDT